jgi:hypothetical protein
MEQALSEPRYIYCEDRILIIDYRLSLVSLLCQLRPDIPNLYKAGKTLVGDISLASVQYDPSLGHTPQPLQITRVVNSTLIFTTGEGGFHTFLGQNSTSSTT